MISVCIPIYNFDVRKLVDDLLDQSDDGTEIILIDDASDKAFKEKNQDLKGEKVTYIELEKNVGRSKIRNLFLKYAKNDFLLFLDCDSQIIDENYLNNYRLNLTESTLLIFGGSTYSKECPSDSQCLRWTYGTTRESKSAKERALNPNKSFMTNNFIVQKQLLSETPFDERITQYGHEDTILGIEMAKKGVKIEHLQNPVMNIDIDTNEVFIRKTEDSLDNLLLIRQFYENPDQLTESITLLKAIKKAEKYGLKWIFRVIYRLFGKSMKRHLIHSKKPSMKVFALYKMSYFVYMQRIKPNPS